MPRPRISIASLLAVIVLAAIGLAAIRAASWPWAGFLTSLTYFALLASLLGIGFGRGPRRVYWVGFALLGWGYVFLTHSNWFAGTFHNHWFAPNGFSALFEVLFPEEAAANAGGMGGMGGMGGGIGGGGFRNMMLGGGPPPPVTSVNLQAFLQIGSMLETLLWAYLGGWVARYFASGRATPASRAPSA